jgi:hypothetical protein
MDKSSTLQEHGILASFRSTFILMKSTPPFTLSWIVLFYFFFLVLFTDGLIWFSSEKLGAFHWQGLVVYSCFGSLLWNLLQTRGLARDLDDIITHGRWFSVGLLPLNPVAVLVGHSIAKTLKSIPLQILCLILGITHVLFGQNLLEIISALLCIYVGAVNITTLGIIALLLTPRGYGGLISAILANVFLIASGAVFPLTMLTTNKYLFLLNPFASAIAVPAGSLMKYLQENGTSVGATSLETGPMLAASLAWMVSLLLIAFYVVRRRSHALFA